MTWWLVKCAGQAHLLTEDEFWDWADRVKYDGVEYEAQPLVRAGGQPGREA
jgi:extradiol dioxygenase family protein